MAVKSVVSSPDAPTPLDGYAQAVKAGPFVYLSGQVPTDFGNGLAPEARTMEGFPHYSLAIKLQTQYLMQNVEAVLRAGGSSCENAVAIWGFLTDITQAPYSREIRNQYFKQRASSTHVGVSQLEVKDALIATDLIATVADGPYHNELITSDRAPIPPGGRYPHAVKAGPYLFTSGQVPTDFVHTVAPPAQIDPAFPYFERSIKKQTAHILDNIKTVLEEAGSSLDNVVKVVVFLTDSRDFQGLDEVWRDYFPKDPPARTVAPARTLFLGGRLEIQTIAVAPDGHVRKDVVTTDRAPRPSIHQSQAVKAGDLVFLSGLMATDYQSAVAPAARVNPDFPYHDTSIRRQTDYIFDTAEAILEEAGSSLDNVVRRQNYLANFADLAVFGELARERLGPSAPVSTTLEVIGDLIIPDCSVLIDATAVITDS